MLFRLARGRLRVDGGRCEPRFFSQLAIGWIIGGADARSVKVVADTQSTGANPRPCGRRESAHPRLTPSEVSAPLRRVLTTACPGAGIFLHAEYQTLAANVSALRQVGERDWRISSRKRQSDAPRQSAPVAPRFEGGLGVYGGHLTTNAWIVGQFGAGDIVVERVKPCRVWIEPKRQPTPP
jgi:hypothetical protein